MHKVYRNAVDEDGKPAGYGVITGEETAKFYLKTGIFDIKTGNLLFLYTDGFENYVLLKEFIEIFTLHLMYVYIPLRIGNCDALAAKFI